MNETNLKGECFHCVQVNKNTLHKNAYTLHIHTYECNSLPVNCCGKTEVEAVCLDAVCARHHHTPSFPPILPPPAAVD